MKSELINHSEKLYYFYEIANHSSIQATSRALGISAPSLSNSIKHLEAALKTTLFTRNSKGIELTTEGKNLYIFCQRFFKEMDFLEKNLNLKTYNDKIKVKIGTFQSIAIYFWPSVYNLLKNEHQIEANIQTNRSKYILEQLVLKNIDVAITVDYVKHPEITKIKLYQDKYSFFGSKDVPDKLKLSNLNKYTLFYFSDAEDNEGKSLKNYIRSAQLNFLEECEIDSFEVIKSFIEKKMGLGILPMKSIDLKNSPIKPVKVEGIDTKFGPHDFYLSYRNDLEIKKNVLDLIIKTAQEAVQQMGLSTTK